MEGVVMHVALTGASHGQLSTTAGAWVCPVVQVALAGISRCEQKKKPKIVTDCAEGVLIGEEDRR